MTKAIQKTAPGKVDNYTASMKELKYLPRQKTPDSVYASLGFMSGLEVHQQLKTEKKLFCRCPAGIYQKEGAYDAELVRHMRPTLSELGEYDGTALMEFKTRKKIIYRIANITTCTYDVDDTPPFIINHKALDIALEIALLLKGNIVGELHITRKQYLDGSIPTGFQRTAIVGIEGEIPLNKKKIRIIQLSIEEDSCREISDIGHDRIYTTDRLGMPLIETVTYPDMKTPDEVAEAAQYIRFLNRSTGKVRTGIGATREDVNVSISGGTRVEIKGVSHILLIPELTHNEAFRQKSFLKIKEILLNRFPEPEKWQMSHLPLKKEDISFLSPENRGKSNGRLSYIAVNLPGFFGILSFFNQPGRMFGNEISDRLKVIACIEKPNMIHSENWPEKELQKLDKIRKKLASGAEDAQIVLWGPKEDISTALEVVEERCRLAFSGVPNETRKALDDGTTLFERVLPGADRMYPDTDSAPIPISQKRIDDIAAQLPMDVFLRKKQLKQWRVPENAYTYLLRNNLLPLLERIKNELDFEPRFVAGLLAFRLKNIQGRVKPSSPFHFDRIYSLFEFIKAKNLQVEITYDMLREVYEHPNMVLDSVLTSVDYKKHNKQSIEALIPLLYEKFKQINRSKDENAGFRWIMKELRPLAVGNIRLAELAEIVRDGGKK